MPQKEALYYSLNTFLKNKFHKKIVKLPIDGGFTCPNRDGTISFTGCTFCSGRGSGDFAPSNALPIPEQIAESKLLLQNKWKDASYIAYFQAFTNTYGPVPVLQRKFEEALSCEDIVGLAIATRPDCLSEQVLQLLSSLSKKAYLWIELGLQTANEKTACRINRGYQNACFEEAVKKLRQYGIDVVVHTILGLPGETEADIYHTMDYVSSMDIQGIKLQLLHVIKGTPLAALYKKEPFPLPSQDTYIKWIINCIARLRSDIVIHRLTGDGKQNDLIAPLWSLHKRSILNGITQELSRNSIFQGISCENKHKIT